MKSLFNKRIPTLLGIILLGVAVAATSYLVQTGVVLFGGATPSENPQNVRITNVSDTSFTVTYITAAHVVGTITMSNATIPSQTILDERDQISGIPHAYTVHSIAVKNAKPGQSYSFSITSGTTTYENNGVPFTLTTATATLPPFSTKPITGKVVQSDGTAAEGLLVYVTTHGGQSLSAFTNSNGIYILPLNAMRTTDLTHLMPLTDSSVMQVLVTDGSNSSQAQIALANARPIPTMTLGSSYNFVVNTVPIASTAASIGFPSFPTNDTLLATPIIITPKKDEGFIDSQPQFTGKGLPNQQVTIQIHSGNIINAMVTTDASGNWTYRPTMPLSVGNHILSITTRNAAGILQTIQQSFTVYASGSQVSQSATPSATLSPTLEPTTTPLPTQTIPTVTPSPTPTNTPTPIQSGPTSSISPKPTLPPTGSNALIISSFLGVATTIAGIVLFVFTKGAI